MQHCEAGPKPCNACGSRERRLLGRVRREGWQYTGWQCLHCGLHFVGERPPHLSTLEGQDRLNTRDWYGDRSVLHFSADEEPHQVPARQRELAFLERHVPVGRLLDVGCGTGWFLFVARQRGWDVAGLEVSAPCVRMVRDEMGIPCHHGGIGDLLADFGAWGVVSLRQVVEHLEDPSAAIARIAERLTPKGLLYLTTPNAAALSHGVKNTLFRLANQQGKRFSSPLDPPQHLFGFTPANLTTLLDRTGFETLVLSTYATGHPTWHPLDPYYGCGRRRDRVLWKLDGVGALFGRGTNILCLARRKG